MLKNPSYMSLMALRSTFRYEWWYHLRAFYHSLSHSLLQSSIQGDYERKANMSGDCSVDNFEKRMLISLFFFISYARKTIWTMKQSLISFQSLRNRYRTYVSSCNLFTVLFYSRNTYLSVHLLVSYKPLCIYSLFSVF